MANEPDKIIRDRCQRAKPTNQEPQKRAKFPYQFIQTDLVGPITPPGFGGEPHFFTFNDASDKTTARAIHTQKQSYSGITGTSIPSSKPSPRGQN
ncbi:hypothetical protein MMC31_007349, partial [Peltigera leucophlebia]|nr:hypothetical protein [Peltigera leucophlebia]